MENPKDMLEKAIEMRKRLDFPRPIGFHMNKTTIERVRDTFTPVTKPQKRAASFMGLSIEEVEWLAPSYAAVEFDDGRLKIVKV